MLAGVHHFGAFLLLAATALLIVVTVTAPVVHSLGLLKIQSDPGASSGREVVLGTFGWCILGGDNDSCSDSMLGYSLTSVLGSFDGTQFSDYASDSTRGLTKVMILHPIATGLCFLGAVLGFGSGVIGSLAASLMAFLAFIVTAVALICDFILFSVVRSNVNDHVGSRNVAFYSAGMWCLLAATVCALLASVILLLTCCAGRTRSRTRSRRSRHSRKADAEMGYTAAGRRPWYRWS